MEAAKVIGMEAVVFDNNYNDICRSLIKTLNDAMSEKEISVSVGMAWMESYDDIELIK